MSAKLSSQLLTALPILLSALCIACGDSQGEGGNGGAAITTSGGAAPSGGGGAGNGGTGGDGGCTEITLTLGEVSSDAEVGYTLFVGESSQSGDSERDTYSVVLWDYGPGTTELGTGDNGSLATCVTCFSVAEDLLNTRTYFATSGTATIDPASVVGAARVTFADVTLAEVEVDEATSESTLVPGARCLHLVAGDLDNLPKQEVCDDEVDNDLDDLLDCSDEDCSATPGCETALAEACTAATPLLPGTPIDGSSGEGSRVLTYDGCETGSFTGGGPEQIYVMTPTESGLAKLRLDTDVDMAMYVRTACIDSATTLGCSDAWPEFVPEWLNLPVEAGVPLYVVVDSYSESGADGFYVLEGTIDPFVAGDRCDTAPALPASDERAYGDLGPDVSLAPAAAATCTGGTVGVGAEAVYQVVLTAGQTVEVTVTPTDYGDAVVYLADSCSATVATCLAGADIGALGEPETVSFTSAAGGTYFLFVDSVNSASLQYGYALTSTVE